jgi:predicted MFS family arabinose efflux permease
MRRLPLFPIILAGFTAFLDLYATQPLLPLLARTFGATRFQVSLTITAPTMAVAIAAPFVGRLADRIGLRRVIVVSAFVLAGATALAGTAATLPQLIAWRFMQGLATPGIFAIALAYIHEEWPASRVGRATTAYMSGTVVGGFTGRALTGIMAADVTWRAGFVALAALNVVAAAILWARLPAERRAYRRPASRGSLSALLRHPQLLATYSVGFCVLCAQVAMFTYVPFPLAAPPFNLSTAALGWIFAVYLVGAIVTPFSGQWIDAYGPRVAVAAAVSIGVTGALLTLVSWLPGIIAGLSIFATAVFIAQASATSHVGASAAQDRGLALGLYSTFYYLGGSAGGAIPALAWSRGGWRACVGLIVGVQLVMLAIALSSWSRRAGPHAEPAPV